MNKLLLILTIGSFFIGGLLYGFTGDCLYYFTSQCFSWLCVGIYIYRKSKQLYIVDKWEKELAKGLLLLAVSNVLDEFIFDPLAFGINEYLLFLMIIIRLICLYYAKPKIDE